MAATLKYRIIGLLSKDISKFYSISDLAKNLNVAYSHTHTFIMKLSKEGVINIQKVGNVSVCQLNLKSQLALSYLSVIESKKTLEWTTKNPWSTKIIEKAEELKDNVHAILIKNSKVIIIVPEKIAGVDFSTFRNRIVINKDHLMKNKQYYTDCIILHGAEKFWSLLG